MKRSKKFLLAIVLVLSISGLTYGVFALTNMSFLATGTIQFSDLSPYKIYIDQGYTLTKASDFEFSGSNIILYKGRDGVKSAKLIIPNFTNPDTGVKITGTSGTSSVPVFDTNVTDVAFVGSQYKTIGGNTFTGNTSLQSVYLPENLQSIGSGAFSGCNTMTSISFPANTQAIGANAFAGCSNLKNVVMMSGLQTIQQGAFSGCAMSEINLPNTLKIIGANAFKNITNLKSITIPSKIVTIQSGVFDGCTSLETITCDSSNLSSSTVTTTNYIYNSSVSWAFSSDGFNTNQSTKTWLQGPGVYLKTDSSLADYIDQGYVLAKLDDFKIEGSNIVEYLGREDSNGNRVKSAKLMIPDMITADGTKITGTLGTETTPVFDSHVTNVLFRWLSVDNVGVYVEDENEENYIHTGSDYTIGSYTFYNNEALESVILPESINAINSYSFAGCSALASITLPENVTLIMDYAFLDCASLNYIKLPPFVYGIYTGAFKNCTGLTSVEMPESLIELYPEAFYNCSELTSISINGGEKYMEKTGVSSSDNVTFAVLYNVFGHCDKLETITINTAKVNMDDMDDSYKYISCSTQEILAGTVGKNVSWIFEDLDGNKKYVSAWQSSQGTYKSLSASGYTVATIDDFTVSTDGKYLTEYKGSATKVIVPELKYTKNATTTTIIGTRGSYYDGSETYYVPVFNQNVTDVIFIGESFTDLGEYTFATNFDYYGVVSKLKSVVLPDNLQKIGYCAFYGCSDLLSITIPDSVTSIGEGAFYSCYGLTSFTIPSTITKVTGEYGQDITTGYVDIFSSCYALAEVYNLSSFKILNYSVSLENGAVAQYPKVVYTSKSEETRVEEENGVKYYVYGSDKIALTPISRTVTSITIADDCTLINSCAFVDCVNLTTITIPSGVQYIGTYSFYNCNSLTYQTIGYVKYLGYKNASGTFVPTVACGVSNKTQTSYTIQSTCKVICTEAFSGCSKMTSITIPESVTGISRDVFSYCSVLKTITCNAEELYSSSYANKIGSAKSTEAGYWLYQGELESTTQYWLGAGIYNYIDTESQKYIKQGYSYTTLSDYAVEGNNIVKYLGRIVDIKYDSSNNTYTYTRQKYTKLIVPDLNGITGTASSYDTDKSYCYSSVFDSPITHVVLVGTSFKTLSDAFYGSVGGAGNDAIEYVILPESLTNIGELSFNYCENLTQITIPNNVQSIGYMAFANTGLNSITIPTSVTNLGSEIFSGCSSLTQITCNSSFTSSTNYISSSSVAWKYTKTGATSSQIVYKWSGAGTYTRLSDIEDKYTKLGYHYVTQSELTFSGTNITKYNGSYTKIMIPDFTVSNKIITGTLGTSSAKVFGSNVTDVVFIGNNYTTIGAYSTGTSLKSIVLSNGVTSIKQLAFAGTSSLTSISIPSSITSVDLHAFNGCSNLTYQTIGNIKYLGYTKSDDSFVPTVAYGVSNKTQTAYTIQSTCKVIYQDTFLNCTKLISVIIPESVTFIGNEAFGGCTALTKVTCNGTLQSDVANMLLVGTNDYWVCTQEKAKIATQNWFSDPGVYTKLIGYTVVSKSDFTLNSDGQLEKYNGTAKKLIIPNFDGVTKVRGLYEWLYDRVTPTFGSTVTDVVFLGTNFTEIGMYAFYANASLQSVILPSNLVEIKDEAFYNCFRLTTITIPSSVTYIGNGSNLTMSVPAFSGCTSLVEVFNHSNLKISAGNYNCGYVGAYAKNVRTIQSDDTNIVTNSNIVYYSNGSKKIALTPTVRSTVTTVVLDSDCTDINQYAFMNCTNLSSITIPETVKTIGYYAFGGCTSLASVKFPSGITSISIGTFSGCTALTSFTIPENVTVIGGSAFNRCSKLTSIRIPSKVVDIGKSVFNYCYALDTIVVDSANTVYNSKNNCNSLINTSTNTLIAGSNNSSIPSGITTIEDFAFSGRKTLATITIPDSVTSIGSYAFAGCSSLKTITVPSSITTISSYAFANCTNIKSVIMSNNVQKICSYAFYYCTSLTTISIPASTTLIDVNAFSSCSRLNTVYINSSDVAKDLVSSSSCGYLLSNINSAGKVYVKDGITVIGSYLSNTTRFATSSVLGYTLYTKK